MAGTPERWQQIEALFHSALERDPVARAAFLDDACGGSESSPHLPPLRCGPDYLVMEYVEGTALKGPLADDQVLKYADQICDALDAAHRSGITHRDLKPGNILLSKQGIKLLDFGLAQIEAGPGDATLTQYMAPEQWEGKRAGARSDIYAFGCVLHEMLRGKRVTVDRPAVAPPFEDILRTCLERDPGKTREHPASQSRLGTVAWIAAGVFAVALAALSIFHFREVPPAEQPLRASIAMPVLNPAISLDGTRVA